MIVWNDYYFLKCAHGHRKHYRINYKLCLNYTLSNHLRTTQHLHNSTITNSRLQLSYLMNSHLSLTCYFLRWAETPCLTCFFPQYPPASALWSHRWPHAGTASPEWSGPYMVSTTRHLPSIRIIKTTYTHITILHHWSIHHPFNFFRITKLYIKNFL